MSKEQELKEIEDYLTKLQQEQQDELDKYNTPEPEKKESLFRFFREVLNFFATWKVGNLKDEEIGYSKLSVRSYLELAKYSELEEMKDISDYFTSKANILGATSMGRGGFFLTTIVTQIKKQLSMRDKIVKKGLFSKGE